MHERRHGEFPVQVQACLCRYVLPRALGKEVEKPGAECQEVSPVSYMFHQYELAAGDKNARDLAKQTHTLLVMAQLVCRKDRECCVE